MRERVSELELQLANRLQVQSLGIPANSGGPGQTVQDTWSYYQQQMAGVPGTVRNVLSYGADPTGVTDSTSGIQNALNAVPALGGVVQIPAGIYRISASLNPTVSGTRIVGDGWGTQIIYDGTVVTGGVFKMADTTQRRVNISWLRLSQSNPTPSGIAIDASYFTDSVLEHLLIDVSGAGAPPLVGVSFNSNTTFYNVLNACRISVSGPNSIGVRCDTVANFNTIRNVRVLCDAVNATAIGFYVNSRGIELDRVSCENSAATGISIGPAGHATTINAPWLEANGTNLAIASGVNALTVVGGSIENASTADYADSGSLTPILLNARSGVLGEHAFTRALTANMREAQDLGLIAWNYDPLFAANTTPSVSGTIYLLGLILRHQALISNLAVYLSGAATTPVANQNYLALVGATGAIRGQTAAGQIDAATGSGGWLSAPMSASYLAGPGRYWVACLFNAATPPGLARATGQSLSGPDAGLTAANFWVAANGTGATALPGSFTMSANTHTGAIAGCVAIS